MKPYLKMTAAEKWDHGLRQRPLTTLAMFPASFIPAGSLIYVAVFIDDPAIKKIAWISWVAVTVFLVSLFIVIWRLEERGAISDHTKRVARKIMYWLGLVISLAAVVALCWPGMSLVLRIKLAALLGGLLSGWYYLRPLLKEPNQPPQPMPLKRHG